MQNKKDNEKTGPLQDTLRNLQDALSEWDQIPDGAESEIDRFRRKTRELLEQLNNQIKALDL